MYDMGNGAPSITERSIFEFLIMVSKHFEVPKNWYLQDSPYPETFWMREFINKLSDAVVTDYSYNLEEVDDGEEEKTEFNPYEHYYNMKLPKSSEYLLWFDNFNDGMNKMGLGISEWYESTTASNRAFFIKEPWETFSRERLEKTGDYFWFLVAFIQKFGSPSQYEASDVRKICEELDSLGHNIEFSMKWFEPLRVWISTRRLHDEFSGKTMKSLNIDFSNVDFSLLEPDDITAIPEYDLEDEYLSDNGNFYHKDKVLLAITASGGLAQALERQDLEPKITNVSTLLGKHKKRKAK